ncbi:MAG: thioredoxin domain-containing protein [Candidatus Nealsonbacteria bacterium]|nr:thioredoxin domain-containing protein [Candidatus Nealsonbacteria bacterium]
MISNKPQTQVVNQEINKILATDHLKWSPAKKNILVEYSDFQCPACKNFQSILKPFEASGSSNFDITQKVTFVYRHYPLVAIHKNAQAAAYAAEAAGKQDKFWQMHDLLFETQDTWAEMANADSHFRELASRLKLNIDKFVNDLASLEVKKKVQEDILSGDQAGVSSTPTFFLNGKKLDNLRSYEEFVSLLKSQQ